MDRFEALHSLGLLHLDIKPENILLGSAQRRSLDSSVLHLIDFGISKFYKDRNGKHLPENNRVLFAGNILFSSFTAFRNKCKYYDYV